MVPVILKVVTDEDGETAEVPLTPDTTSRDVVDCLRDPGDEPCCLVHTTPLLQRTLGDGEKPLEVLQRSATVGTFKLKYSPIRHGKILNRKTNVSGKTSGESRTDRKWTPDPGHLFPSMIGSSARGCC
nr:apoptosis-stimulating of p53 protein 2-like [Halyomorpha halys]